MVDVNPASPDAEGGVLILDGAQGTELERRGVSLAGSRLWSAQLVLDDPALVQAIHQDYLEAGSDVITTFTYQASMPGMLEAGLSPQQAAGLLTTAVRLAAAARDAFWAGQQGAAEPRGAPRRRRPLLALSCGSYGAYLADGSEFRGDYADTLDEAALAAFHATRIDAVRADAQAWGAVDLLAFETLPCLAEATAIARLLAARRYGKPAWLSFSCRDEQATCHGELFAEACVPALAACPEVFALGVNCTNPAFVSPLLTAARAKLGQLAAAQPGAGGGEGGGEAALGPSRSSRPRLRLLAYPNSGEAWDGKHRCWIGTAHDLSDPSAFAAEAVGAWVGGCGATLVGGCCRTGPQHIRALRARLCGGEGGSGGAEGQR